MPEPTRPLEKPLPKDEGWADVNAPELHKWDKPGEMLAGILVSASHVEIEGKKVLQYVLQLGEKSFKCLATYDLRQKLTAAHRGLAVRIKYLGEDQNIRGGPNNQAMKIFSVQVKGTPKSPERDSGPITDDDIPF